MDSPQSNQPDTRSIKDKPITINGESCSNYSPNIQQSCESNTDDALLSLYFTKAFRKEAINFHGEIQDMAKVKSHASEHHSSNEDFIVDVVKDYMPSVSAIPDQASAPVSEEVAQIDSLLKELENGESYNTPQTGYQSQQGIYSQIQGTGVTYVFNVTTHYSYDAKILTDKEDNQKQPSFIRRTVGGIMDVLFPAIGHPYLGVVLVMGLSMMGVFFAMSHVINGQIHNEIMLSPAQSLNEPALIKTASSLDHNGEQELGMMQTKSYILISPQYYHEHCLLPLGEKNWPNIVGHRYAYSMNQIDSLPVSQINENTIISDLYDPVIDAVSCQGFSHEKIDGENELFYQGKPVRFVIKSLNE